MPDDILLYTGRHTFGTEMMEATGNVFAVSQAMGHQDIKSMNPYQHHNPARLGDAINQRLSSRHTLRHTDPPPNATATTQVDTNTELRQCA